MNKLESFYPRYACKQFNNILPLLKHNVGYATDNIPQQQDVKFSAGMHGVHPSACHWSVRLRATS